VVKQLALALALFAAIGAGAAAAAERIVLASTTSTQNSGLFDWILPIFTAATGIEVSVVAVGTGQALRLARRGDADVVLVHDRAAELDLVAEGSVIERRDLMYNDFVLVGPGDDPARAGGKDATAALTQIARAAVRFVSRGDDSGTHAAERGLWREAGIDPHAGSGRWYLESGSGMGATLNTAAAMNAYTLTDRATWAAFGNKRALKILVENDRRLFNPYGVMLVNPARFPHVKADPGRRFVAWLTGPEGRVAITGFKIAGQQMFFVTDP
jgi:tungstate transport system substrate-binding protein